MTKKNIKESEKNTEKHLVKMVKILGGVTVKGNSANFRGFSDRIIFLPNAIVGVLELKSEGKTPTKIQQHWLDLLSNFGFKTGCADTKTSVDTFLKRLSNADS